MRTNRNSLLILFLVGLTPLWMGTTCSQRDLAEGPYQGDRVLWEADGAILLARDAILDIQGWASRNPSVAARPEVAAAVSRVNKLRDGIVERKPDGGIADHEWYAKLQEARRIYAETKAAIDQENLNDAIDIARFTLEQLRAVLPAEAITAPSS